MRSVLSLLLLVVLIAVPSGGCAAEPASASVSDDIRALIESARGAPAALCDCAARGVGNHWGSFNAPASPLGRPVRDRHHRQRELSDEDVRFLLTSLDTPDPCVRELAVRILGSDDREEIVTGLVQRLTAPDSSLRLTAALGLGFITAEKSVEPLLRAMNDEAAGVRANAVWALG